MTCHSTLDGRQRVLLSVLLMAIMSNADAACVDNGDGSFTCSGVSENQATTLDGRIILDNTSAPVILDNVSADPAIPAILTRTSAASGPLATLDPNGSQAITINNIGGSILFEGGGRVFDPATWSNDASGQLFNNGVAAGYAAAVYAGPAVSALYVNNHPVYTGVFNPDTYYNGIPATIGANGAYTASIYANNPYLKIDNTGSIGDIVSFAGASYTAPPILDGTGHATNVQAGTTIIDNKLDNNPNNIANIYVIDRNPLLDAAKAANPALALAYTPADVGPRNSVITNTGYGFINNISLGSGAHVINNIDGNIYGTIYVDQRDSEVIEVNAGVASTLYKVHGDRTFTLNHVNTLGVQIGNIVLDDVVGAVNNINFTGVSAYYGSMSANGLGDNIFSYNCAFGTLLQPCYLQGNVSGFSTLNLNEQFITLASAYTLRDAINISASNVWLVPSATLTATSVNILPGGQFGIGNPRLSIGAAMGNIVGDLNNFGTVSLGDATLHVDGNAQMHAGSDLSVTVSQTKAGLLDTTGTTTFLQGAYLAPILGYNSYITQGTSHVVANHVVGLPSIRSGDGFLQWTASQVNGDLVLTADLGVPQRLQGEVSQAAINASRAVFSAIPDNPLSMKLLSDLQNLHGENVARAAERLRPEINDGSMRVVLGTTDKIFSLLDTRMLDSYLVSARGDAVQPAGGGGLWVQGFGDRGQMESVQGGDGYGISVAGMAGGIDKALDSTGNRRGGVAFGYSQGSSTNAGQTVNNRVDINSYIASAYAMQSFDDWYVNGAVGVGRHVYDTRRQLLQNSAAASHDSWQFAARIGAGMPLLFNENFALIPSLSLDYSHIEESGYKEAGKVSSIDLDPERTDQPIPVLVNGMPKFSSKSSPINLRIEDRSFDSIRAGLGARAIFGLQGNDWAAELELRALYRHEFGDLAQDSRARFVMGGDRFTSPGLSPTRDALLLGGSVRITGDDGNDQLTLTTSYDADIREKYFGQLVSLNLRYDFDQGPRYTKRAAARKAAFPARQALTTPVTATQLDILSLQQAMQNGEVDEEVGLSEIDPHKEQAVNEALQRWTAALSNKNLEGYLASYAANFVIPDGSTRQQWERKRKVEFTRSGSATVKISYLSIKPDGDKVMALFNETVNQDGREETVQKIVDFANRDGRWLIVREDSLSIEN